VRYGFNTCLGYNAPVSAVTEIPRHNGFGGGSTMKKTALIFGKRLAVIMVTGVLFFPGGLLLST